MKNFNLPDLGEGLPDAEIVEWHVKEGDHVKEDQPMVSMETAKAVVDVPCPKKLNGRARHISYKKISVSFYLGIIRLKVCGHLRNLKNRKFFFQVL